MFFHKVRKMDGRVKMFMYGLKNYAKCINHIQKTIENSLSKVIFKNTFLLN